MRTLSLFISALILTFMATEVSAAPSTYTCRIQTGYGTAIGSGSTPLAAKQAARETCGSKIIDQYFAQRGRIPADVEDDLVLACVNLECQK
jgi:hypothetical protein